MTEPDVPRSILFKPEVPESERHIVVQAMVRRAVGFVRQLPIAELEAHLARISTAQATGSIADPAMFLRNDKALRVENDVCRALMDFAEALDQIVKDAAVEVGGPVQ